MGNQSRLRLFIGYFSYLQNIKIRKRHLVETKLRAGNQVLIMMKLVLAFVGLITSTNGLRLTNGKMQWDAYLYCPNGDRVKAPYHEDNVEGITIEQTLGVLSASFFVPNRSVAEGIYNYRDPARWQEWLEEKCPSSDHCMNFGHRNFYCDRGNLGLWKDKYKSCCIIHDMCYETYRSKEDCDHEFQQNLKASDFGKADAHTIWLAVKIWGEKRSGQKTC